MNEIKAVKRNELLDENNTAEVSGNDKILERVDNEVPDLTMESNKWSAQTIRDSSINNSVLSISFSTNDNFNSLQNDVINFLQSYIDFDVEVDESNLLINVTKDTSLERNDWVIVDRNDVSLKQDDAKDLVCENEKRKKNDKREELFVLDVTPSLATKHSLQYECKFGVLANDNAAVNSNQEEAKLINIAACFNCGENHNLRDCTKARNQAKINTARQKFKSQQTKNLRYHLEAEQLYAHLKPGRLSNKLRSALGLEEDQLPDHIYLMRRLGYPPGWEKEIEPEHPELVLFNFDGKKETSKNLKCNLNPDIIIEYPGFNVPCDKHIKDEYRLHRCPPYSKDNQLWSKYDMMKRIEQNWTSNRDNLKTCDMDVQETEYEASCEKLEECDISREKSISPSLLTLESKKKEILQQLSQDTNSTKVQNADDSECLKSNLSINEDSDVNITRLVKTTCFGTPIIKTASAYANLPSAEKFSKDVSDVINFENLPNATGHYQQLSDVLKDVRKSMKDIVKGN